jgi:hypothetical protein
MNVRAGTITHHIEGGWLPNWVGQNQTRAFQLSGDSLSLDADSTAWHAHRKRHFLAALFGGGYGIKLDLR